MHFGNVPKANYSPKRNHRIMIKQSVLLGLQPHSSNTSGAAVRVSTKPSSKEINKYPMNSDTQLFSFQCWTPRADSPHGFDQLA